MKEGLSDSYISGAMSAIFVKKEGKRFGPFTTSELERKVEAGDFSGEDSFWADGMDDWAPLATVIELVPMESAGAASSEDVLFDRHGIRLTRVELKLPGEAIPVAEIRRAEPQIETVRRTAPYIGSIVLGLLLVCVGLVDIPRRTPAHWVAWGVIMAGLGLWWLRCLYGALRPERSEVVIDLRDGKERIIPTKPGDARPLSDAINSTAPGA